MEEITKLTREVILDWISIYCHEYPDKDVLFDYVNEQIHEGDQIKYMSEYNNKSHKELLDILENNNFNRDFFKQFDISTLIEILSNLGATEKFGKDVGHFYIGRNYAYIFREHMTKLSFEKLKEGLISIYKSEYNVPEEIKDEDLLGMINEINKEILQKRKTIKL